jgi:PhnB protein
MTNPIPEGYRNVNVILTVDDGAKAINFYKQAFGAKEISRLPMGDKIGHAELQIGDTRIMLNDEFPDVDNLSRERGTTVGLIIYTDDVDHLRRCGWRHEKDAGGEPVLGDRWGPDRSFGYKWSIATHVEDVPPEQSRRMAQAEKRKQQPETARACARRLDIVPAELSPERRSPAGGRR